MTRHASPSLEPAITGAPPLDAYAPPAPLVEPAELEATVESASAVSRLDIFVGLVGIFLAAFLVTLLVTPLMRRLAIAHGVIDHPNDPRKAHKSPVAYLGGAAVYLGLLAAVALSYADSLLGWGLLEGHASALEQKPFPISIVLGMTVIMLTGLIDDVVGLDPRLKIAGQLAAAAALALDDVGVKVAAGALRPIGRLLGNQSLVYTFELPAALPLGIGDTIQVDLIYWAGTAVIAMFVLGACNASNLIDGLDGLCSGVTGVAAAGLLIIALGLAAADDGPLDNARLVLGIGLLGACLGFLPHNFNPATIFLGDCGSLLLGFCSITLVLSLGDTGKTQLVIAGLIIYLLPILDTTLAIIRRKMAGLPMSAPDAQHLHHILKRSLGVKGAALTLYGVAGVFATLGVVVSVGRARVAYALALVIAAVILVTAIKIARIKQIEEQALRSAAAARPGRAPRPAPAASPGEVETPAR